MRQYEKKTRQINNNQFCIQEVWFWFVFVYKANEYCGNYLGLSFKELALYGFLYEVQAYAHSRTNSTMSSCTLTFLKKKIGMVLRLMFLKAEAQV